MRRASLGTDLGSARNFRKSLLDVQVVEVPNFKVAEACTINQLPAWTCRSVVRKHASGSFARRGAGLFCCPVRPARRGNGRPPGKRILNLGAA